MELFNIHPYQTCGDENFVQIENNMQWIHSREGEQGVLKIPFPK
jgi:hypothetical protein